MNQSVDEFNRAKSKMAGTFDKAMAEAEALRKAAADVPGTAAATALTQIDERLGRAGTSLTRAVESALGKARETAAATDDYVQARPWTAIGIAVVVGTLTGFLAARR